MAYYERLQGYREPQLVDEIPGPFLVHAARKFDCEGEEWVRENYPEIIMPQFYVGLRGLMGGVMGSIELTGVVEESPSPWFFGPYGFQLANPRIVPFQMWPGKLGFFDIPTLPDLVTVSK